MKIARLAVPDFPVPRRLRFFWGRAVFISLGIHWVGVVAAAPASAQLPRLGRHVAPAESAGIPTGTPNLGANFSALASHRGTTPESPPDYAETETLREDATLRSVAFHSAEHGIAVGDRGAIVTTDDGGRTWSPRESHVECRLDDVVWIGPDRAIVVGGGYDAITQISRAVVLTTDDGGRRWRRRDDRDLPRFKSVTLNPDRTLTADGDWSHSSLASQFESRDGGGTWTGVGDPELIRATPRRATAGSSEMLAWAQATSTAVTIRDACRVDGSGMCAVGDHGVILTSGDEGKTWSTARGKDRRTAVLMVASRGEQIAWSILGSETLESRHRVSVLLEQTRHETRFRASEVDLANQAAVALGAAGVDPFRTLAKAAHDRGTGETPTDDDSIVSEASRWIAVMRPAVVLLDETLSRETKDAFFQAATSAGVQRVVHYSTTPSQATRLHHNALLPKTGVLAGDLISDAMHLIAPHQNEVATMSISFVYDAAPSRRTGESTASGLALHPGRMLTPRPSLASRRQLQIVQARMKQSQRIDQLLDVARSREPFPKSLASVLDQTAREDQFRFAWAILAQTQTSDRVSVETHKAVLDEISRRFADRSVGKWAKLRLQSINHSTEWVRLESILKAGKASITHSPAPVTQSVAVSPFQVPRNQSDAAEIQFAGSPVIERASGNALDEIFLDAETYDPSAVRQVSAIAPLIVPRPEMIQYDAAATTISGAEVDLTWEFHPAVLFGMEASRRRGDSAALQSAETPRQPGDQPASLRQLSESRGNPWGELLKPSGRHVIVANRAAERPLLDGVLDESCWQSNEPSTQGPTTQGPTTLQLAYDDDYIYVAVTCFSSLIGNDDLGGGPATPRDNDLSLSDRLRLRLDVDKDLLTSMQFQTTTSRHTHDAIDGNAAWQPTWYLDVNRGSDTTTFEIAILRRDVLDLPIETDSPWGETSWFVSAEILTAGTHAINNIMPDPSEWIRVVFE